MANIAIVGNSPYHRVDCSEFIDGCDVVIRIKGGTALGQKLGSKTTHFVIVQMFNSPYMYNKEIVSSELNPKLLMLRRVSNGHQQPLPADLEGHTIQEMGINEHLVYLPKSDGMFLPTSGFMVVMWALCQSEWKNAKIWAINFGFGAYAPGHDIIAEQCVFSKLRKGNRLYFVAGDEPPTDHTPLLDDVDDLISLCNSSTHADSQPSKVWRRFDKKEALAMWIHEGCSLQELVNNPNHQVHHEMALLNFDADSYLKLNPHLDHTKDNVHPFGYYYLYQKAFDFCEETL